MAGLYTDSIDGKHCEFCETNQLASHYDCCNYGASTFDPAKVTAADLDHAYLAAAYRALGTDVIDDASRSYIFPANDSLNSQTPIYRY